MNYFKLKKLNYKQFFSSKDVSDALNIKKNSGPDICSRYAKKGYFVRIKKDMYVFEEDWQNYALKDYMRISNYIQVPSYLSLTTALSYYGISTQVQQGYFENIAVKRSISFKVKNVEFKYYKAKKEYYFGFQKINDVFIATPEKALLDMIYLESIGRYSPDYSSIDVSKIDNLKLSKILKKYPEKIRIKAEKICRT